MYAALRKLDQGYEGKYKDFTLPSHAEQNFSPAQRAEALADYLSSISQELTPIPEEKSSPFLKEKLKMGRNDSNTMYICRF